MYTKITVGAVAIYPIALMVANISDSPMITRILAVIAGIVGLLHVAYEALWRIDTTWKQEGETTISYARELIWSVFTPPIVSTALIIAGVWMIWTARIGVQIIGLLIIVAISYGACLSADHTARRASKYCRDEKLV